jgi:hypothetical protein
MMRFCNKKASEFKFRRVTQLFKIATDFDYRSTKRKIAMYKSHILDIGNLYILFGLKAQGYSIISFEGP